MADETYDDGRVRNLEEMLRALAARISTLDADGHLLSNAGELLKLIGDVRSELFHYEVRCTYDTPEIAEHRRLVEEARPDESSWEPTSWSPDDDEEKEW
jgi:hypothetical protein